MPCLIWRLSRKVPITNLASVSVYPKICGYYEVSVHVFWACHPHLPASREPVVKCLQDGDLFTPEVSSKFGDFSQKGMCTSCVMFQLACWPSFCEPGSANDSAWHAAGSLPSWPNPQMGQCPKLGGKSKNKSWRDLHINSTNMYICFFCKWVSRMNFSLLWSCTCHGASCATEWIVTSQPQISGNWIMCKRAFSAICMKVQWGIIQYFGNICQVTSMSLTWGRPDSPKITRVSTMNSDRRL